MNDLRDGILWILDGHLAVPTKDAVQWAEAFEKADRQVAKSEVDGCDISTVFIGINHNFGSGPPHIFETMVFGGPCDGFQDRYSSWEEAEAGHRSMVAYVTRYHVRHRKETGASGSSEPQDETNEEQQGHKVRTSDP